MLTKDLKKRFERNIILKELGQAGQQKLLEARVLVIGVGGLGSPAALYLAAAGVGTLGIVDSDRVELSNLQRQILHFTEDIGREKVKSAAAKLTAFHPQLKVVPHCEFVSADNIRGLIQGYDFVIDGTDNFAAKFLINDACVQAGIPFSHAGVLRFSGVTMTVIPGQSACYRCAFPDTPPKDSVPSPADVGILGSVAGLMGTLQATEAIKIITGAGTPLTNTLLSFDTLEMNFRTVILERDTKCVVCGVHSIDGFNGKDSCDHTASKSR